MIASLPFFRSIVIVLALLFPGLTSAEPISGAFSSQATEQAAPVQAALPAGLAVAEAPAADPVPTAAGEEESQSAMPESMVLPAELRTESVSIPADSEANAEVVERLDDVKEDVLPLFTMLTLSADEEAGKTDFEAGAGRLGEFRPFNSAELLRRNGALWLYLPLEETDDDAPQSLWLDLGRQVPDTRLWMSADGFRWDEAQPLARGLYSLRAAGAEGHVLIRMDGMPGMWFSPVLRSPVSAADAPERGVETLLLALLGLLALVDLLFCLAERSEFRFWVFVLASAALAQRFWAVPSTASGVGVEVLPGIFAAGIALVILPHVGRVLMRTRLTSPHADTFFLLLALPGACAALLPLIPGMSWTVRLLALWPLAAVLCVLPAFVLLCRGIHGSGSFTLACLAMGGGAAAALSGVGSGASSSLAAFALPAGQILGLLILTVVPSRRMLAEPRTRRGRQDGSPHSALAKEGTFKENALVALQRGLKSSVEELLDASCRLDQALNRAGISEEQRDIMEHADSLVAAARRLSEKAMDTPPEEAPLEASSAMFELRTVIQSAFAAVFGEAEKKGLGLAWYVAPHLGRRFKGDSVRLTALLSLLVTDAVCASTGGAVCVRVRRADMSTHPGHLLFTVSDSGEGQPPRDRSSRLLSRVWELAAAHGGEMFVNSGPAGTEIGFSMECLAYEDDGVTERAVPGRAEKGDRIVIAASSDSITRQMLPHYLSGLGFRVWEARDAAEAASLYSANPAVLVIFDGSLAEDDMVQALAAIRMHEGEHALAAVPFLLLAKDALQAERMTKAGCDESLLRPLLRKDLRAMVRWLAAPVGTMPRPELSAQSVTLAALLAGADPGSLRLQRKNGLKAARAERSGGNVESTAPVAVHEEAGLTVEQETVHPDADTIQPDSAGGESTAVQEHGEAVPTEGEGESIRAAESLHPQEAPAFLSEMPDEKPLSDGDAPCEKALTGDDEHADDDPVPYILSRLDTLDEALDCLDSPAIRRITAELAELAESRGMRTLADMACGAGEAWEEADVESARQIVADMRAETARL